MSRNKQPVLWDTRMRVSLSYLQHPKLALFWEYCTYIAPDRSHRWLSRTLLTRSNRPWPSLISFTANARASYEEYGARTRVQRRLGNFRAFYYRSIDPGTGTGVGMYFHRRSRDGQVGGYDTVPSCSLAPPGPIHWEFSVRQRPWFSSADETRVAETQAELPKMEIDGINNIEEGSNSSNEPWTLSRSHPNGPAYGFSAAIRRSETPPFFPHRMSVVREPLIINTYQVDTSCWSTNTW
ncbi:hypothetical protein F4778DRAFT_404301 [Xylariomycetidae sp. FL2044]|nr:hypothetical protein F4778DRAFT_404301 [Xylariomycetidae sp. FL2044]